MSLVGDRKVLRNKSANSRKPTIWKGTAVVLFFAVVIAFALHLPWEELCNFFKGYAQIIQQLGVLGHLLFLIITTVSVLLGMPRLIFCALGGVFFGWIYGLFWSITATTLAYYIQFALVRWCRLSWAQHYLLKYPKLRHLIQDEGFSAVILARQIPLPGVALNVAFALSPVKNRHYLLGTIIGQIPEALPTVLLSAGIVEGNGHQMTLKLVAALLCFIILSVLFKKLLKHLKTKNLKQNKDNSTF